MTTFQLLSLALFAVALLINYGGAVLARINAGRVSVINAAAAPVTPPAVAPATSAVYTVKDLTTLAELRDRLAANGCVEGADACKTLIRIMLEFKKT
jgi:hypothetical protein